MSQYARLADYYDRLIEPAVYSRFADRICALLEKQGIREGLVLDLCCGTGSLTRELSLRGYEMIGCDLSPEMLEMAREKCAGLPVPPVWICQDAAELDLYGTVRAAVCCLDSVNYLTDLRQLRRAFVRVSLFLESGGLFLFDVRSRGLFQELSGSASVQEEADFYCVWEYGFDPKSGRGQHQIDLFLKKNTGDYARVTELHQQRWYSIDILRDALERAGLRPVGVYHGLSGKKTREEQGRLFFAAEKK